LGEKIHAATHMAATIARPMKMLQLEDGWQVSYYCLMKRALYAGLTDPFAMFAAVCPVLP
jgi:hypothetical protein